MLGAGSRKGWASPARVEKRAAAPCAVGGKGGRPRPGRVELQTDTSRGARPLETGSGARARSNRWGREGFAPASTRGQLQAQGPCGAQRETVCKDEQARTR